MSGPGSKLVELVPVVVQHNGSPTIAEYTVLSVQFTTEIKQHHQAGLIFVEIQLGRDFKSIFIVTYLPTILMNIINQATNYLDVSEHLEAIITVNITCMMVLSALYISVSNSLPATSSIKVIDYWLLYSLVFPFSIILLNIGLYFVTRKPNIIQVEPVEKGALNYSVNECKKIKCVLKSKDKYQNC